MEVLLQHQLRTAGCFEKLGRSAVAMTRFAQYKDSRFKDLLRAYQEGLDETLDESARNGNYEMLHSCQHCSHCFILDITLLLLVRSLGEQRPDWSPHTQPNLE